MSSNQLNKIINQNNLAHLSPGGQVPLDQLQTLQAIRTPIAYRRKKENAWAGCASPDKSLKTKATQNKLCKRKNARASAPKLNATFQSADIPPVFDQWKRLKETSHCFPLQPETSEEQITNPLLAFIHAKTPAKPLPKQTLLSLVDTALIYKQTHSAKQSFAQTFLDCLRQDYITEAAVTELTMSFLKTLWLLYVRRDAHGVFVARLLGLYHPDPISTATSEVLALVHSALACLDTCKELVTGGSCYLTDALDLVHSLLAEHNAQTDNAILHSLKPSDMTNRRFLEIVVSHYLVYTGQALLDLLKEHEARQTQSFFGFAVTDILEVLNYYQGTLPTALLLYQSLKPNYTLNNVQLFNAVAQTRAHVAAPTETLVVPQPSQRRVINRRRQSQW